MEKDKNVKNRTTKQERIRMAREKETSKYLGILEADTIKLVEMKEKILKSVFLMNIKTSAAGISS